MIREKTRVWTVRELMKFAISHMHRRGFEDARLNVELLLAHALSCQRITLYTNFDKPVSKEEMKKFRSLYERRLNREPVQYITGSTSFMGLSFSVDPRVLIPRPETETLVEQVMLQCGSLEARKSISIVEIGTGSGNIAVALAKYVKNAAVTSIDNSSGALEVARQNASTHGVLEKITFEQMDTFEPVDQLLRKRFDILVSNPPYIPKDEWDQLQMEVRRFEPTGALTDGNDGFEFYRRILELAPYLLVDHGMVLLEVGDGQAEAVRQMMLTAGFSRCAVVTDLQNVPRIVTGACRSRSRNLVISN
ncbi:MAG: peptide chain release factor N(5)-glutamine methyltransferase [Bacteroidota bacterium]